MAKGKCVICGADAKGADTLSIKGRRMCRACVNNVVKELVAFIKDLQVCADCKKEYDTDTCKDGVCSHIRDKYEELLNG